MQKARVMQKVDILKAGVSIQCSILEPESIKAYFQSPIKSTDFQRYKHFHLTLAVKRPQQLRNSEEGTLSWARNIQEMNV